jgi:hypothetical protein
VSDTHVADQTDVSLSRSLAVSHDAKVTRRAVSPALAPPCSTGSGVSSPARATSVLPAPGLLRQ